MTNLLLGCLSFFAKEVFASLVLSDCIGASCQWWTGDVARHPKLAPLDSESYGHFSTLPAAFQQWRPPQRALARMWTRQATLRRHVWIVAPFLIGCGGKQTTDTWANGTQSPHQVSKTRGWYGLMDSWAHMCDRQNSIHVVRSWHRFTRPPIATHSPSTLFTN